MDNSHTARRRHIGFAPEATRGTAAAAAAFWLRHSSMDFYDRIDNIDNESAMGVDEKISDSEVAGIFADGSAEGKIAADSFGVVLVGMFGQPVTTPVAGGGYSHRFRFSDALGSLTAFRKTKMNDLAFAKVTLSSLEIAARAKDWSTFSADATAMKGVGVTSTPAYINNEPEFSGKNVKVQVGANEAAMIAADRISASTMTSTIERDVEAYFGLGNEQPDDIDTGDITISGELTFRYANTTLEDFWRAGSKVWLRTFMENAAVDLGGGNRPSLSIVYPKASLRTPAFSDDLSKKVDQTFNITGERNDAVGYAIEITLVNSTASYAAA